MQYIIDCLFIFTNILGASFGVPMEGEISNQSHASSYTYNFYLQRSRKSGSKTTSGKSKPTPKATSTPSPSPTPLPPSATPPKKKDDPPINTDDTAGTPRITIAVLDFGDASLTDLKKNLGRQLAILLSNAFTRQANIIVVERLQLDRVTDQVNKEEDTDRFKENPLVRIGKLLKADALILGDITEFTATKKGKSFGIASKTSYTAKLGLAVRLVDISSGEVLDAVNLEETADEKGESNPFWQKGAELDEDLKVTLFTKAANQAVGKAVVQLNKLIQEKRHTSSPPTSASPTAKPIEFSGSLYPASAAPTKQPKVAVVEGTVITLNVGKAHGVAVGAVYRVMRQGKVTKDPNTGEVLDVEETEVGKIKITEVRDNISIGTLLSGSGVKMGDLVKPQWGNTKP